MPSAEPVQLTFEAIAKLRADIPTGLFVVLDHRRQMFVLHLLAQPGLNAAAAALAAGATKRRAKQSAHEWLAEPAVKAALDAAMTVRAQSVAVTAERVLREVDTVGLSDITHYRLDDEGNLQLADGAPPDAMRAVRSFKRKVRFVKARDGVGFDKEVESEFTLWGKPETLRLSMQHRGMLVEKVELKTPEGTGVLAVPLPPDAAQWAAGAAAQQTALVARAPAPESAT